MLASISDLAERARACTRGPNSGSRSVPLGFSGKQLPLCGVAPTTFHPADDCGVRGNAPKRAALSWAAKTGAVGRGVRQEWRSVL